MNINTVVAGNRYVGVFEVTRREHLGEETNSEAADLSYLSKSYQFEGLGQIIDLESERHTGEFRFSTPGSANQSTGFFAQMCALLPTHPRIDYPKKSDGDDLLAIIYQHINKKCEQEKQPLIAYHSMCLEEYWEIKKLVRTGQSVNS